MVRDKKYNIPVFNIPIWKAEADGICEKCVGYDPGPIKAPWTTHCHSTLGRIEINEGMCTKLAFRVIN
jgi:hypothetical protein